MKFYGVIFLYNRKERKEGHAKYGKLFFAKIFASLRFFLKKRALLAYDRGLFFMECRGGIV